MHPYFGRKYVRDMDMMERDDYSTLKDHECPVGWQRMENAEHGTSTMEAELMDPRTLPARKRELASELKMPEHFRNLHLERRKHEYMKAGELAYGQHTYRKLVADPRKWNLRPSRPGASRSWTRQRGRVSWARSRSARLGTAVGGTATTVKSSQAVRVTANATEAGQAQSGVVKPGGPLVVKRGLAPVRLPGLGFGQGGRRRRRK